MMAEGRARILGIDGLRIERGDGVDIVDEVSLDVSAGEILAIVGESGCGKTSTALALLGHARSGTRIVEGRVVLDGQDILALDARTLRGIRGARISYVPQDPGANLSPRHRIGEQIAEAMLVHHIPSASMSDRVRELLVGVGLPGDQSFQRRYPFELSGGQQQRVAIAMAIACLPRVVVLDEPTTGLDVTTQARILDLLTDIAAGSDIAYVYVTHDLAVVSRIATHVAVMYAGRVVERGPRQAVLQAPLHPYTAMLIGSMPRLHRDVELTGIAGTTPVPGQRPPGCFFAPRCPLADDHCRAEFPPSVEVAAGQWVRCWHPADRRPGAAPLSKRGGARATTPPVPLLEVAGLVAGYGKGRARHRVIDGIGFSLGAGECLALVGESGSGKSTIGRCLAGLHAPDAGTLAWRGNSLAPRAADRRAEELKAMQIVFQNPERSLNPNETVAEAIIRPLRHFGLAASADARRAAAQELDRVQLPAAILDYYPRELSGGQKQRVAIARAMAAQPSLLICDEITSALDVSTQAAVVSLLNQLRQDGLALLFITHNLALVRAIADNVLVLRSGTVREFGATVQVIDSPENEYTRGLLAAAPDLD